MAALQLHHKHMGKGGYGVLANYEPKHSNHAKDGLNFWRLRKATLWKFSCAPRKSSIRVNYVAVQ